MKLFKNLITLTLSLLFLTSCNDSRNVYPKYTIVKIEYIPDSLKVDHRVWITETIRSASQHMTGGDYEDVDATIRQAKWTADDLFSVSVIGLRKEINDNYFDDLKLKPSELNKYEFNILDSLKNVSNKKI